MGELSPFVYWAQTESHVTLRVDLRDVKSPDVLFNEDELEFSAVGLGAKGRHKYHFVLEFFLPVNPKKSQFRVMDREIEFSITKKTAQWWPRVTADPKKPAWLKIDFDKWKSEEEEEEKITASDLSQQLKDIYDPKRDQKLQEEAYQKIYMFMYNLFMFTGFTAIVLMMLFYIVKDGDAALTTTYTNVGGLFMFFQIVQLFDIFFSYIGWTKGGVGYALIQICGRLFIYILMIMAEPRMQDKPVVFYLLLFWSIAEVLRYPYYILKIFDFEYSVVTWIRYSMWIPLYPLGFVCEGIVILRNIPYLEETKRLSYHLPNALNWSFDMPSIARVYLLLLAFPLMFVMMTNMYRSRVHKIGSKRLKKKSE